MLARPLVHLGTTIAKTLNLPGDGISSVSKLARSVTNAPVQTQATAVSNAEQTTSTINGNGELIQVAVNPAQGIQLTVGGSATVSTICRSNQ